LLWGLGLAILVGMISGVSSQPGLFNHLSNLIFDQYQRIQSRPDAGAPVTIVDIDSVSLHRIGQWPWPRTTIARLVDRLGNMGAAAIAFDMVFSEPDRTSPSRVIKTLRNEGAKVKIQLPPGRHLLNNDAVLARAFKHYPVVAGMAVTNSNRTAPASPKASFAYGGTSPKQYLPAYSGGVRNLPILSKQASGIGFFSFPLSGDGVVRSLPLIAKDHNHLYPALSIAALRVAQHAKTLLIRSTGASGTANTGRPAMVALKDGKFSMPTGAKGQFRVYYSRMPHMRTLSAANVLKSKHDAAMANDIRGHIVLIGSSAVGLRDIVATPINEAMPGVRAHANIIDQIIGQTFLTRPDWARGAEILLAAALGIVLLLFEQWSGTLISSSAAFVLLLLPFGLSWFAFSDAHLLLDPILPSTAVLAVFALTTPALLLLTNREKRFIHSAFAHYLSPQLVAQLAESPDALRLGGENRELTLLFSDIRNFTSLSENMDPDGLTRLLNEFLTPTTEILLEAEATIDKYIGDAIMAFWNAPLAIADHRRKACLAALRMQTALDELNQTADHSLAIGIGLHSGQCCVGNLGSTQRFNYSAIGDSVNLASRVESLTKQYGLSILLTEFTLEGAEGLACLEVDRVRVMGRVTAITLYTLLGGPDYAKTPGFKSLQEVHALFLDAYRQVDLNAAHSTLQTVRELAPAHILGLMEVYEASLSAMRVNPPPADWDGVYIADQK